MATENTHQYGHRAELSLADVEKALHAAVDDLYRNEPDIDHFSTETAQTEWNLAAHLAPEIVKYFVGYSYDIDVVKSNLGNRRPDIIIHKRGPETRYNLLVVEVKRNGSANDIRDDMAKIENHWFSERLRYRFGATINLKLAGAPDIVVFGNSSLHEG